MSARPDKRRVREAFDRAAARYDEAAVLQREVGTRLVERLELIRLQPERILDLGAGTGHCSAALAARYPKARLLSLDLAPGMLQRARSRLNWWQRRRHQYVCADAEALPLADASVDLLFSNLTLQWCADLERTFAEFRRVLRPGGLLLFSTFGPDTLKELRAAWAAVDGGAHVNEFVDMHDIGDAMLRARLADPVMDREDITLTYGEVRTLLHDLKAIGAHHVNAGRAPGMTGKGKFRRMLEAYEAYRRDGRLPATYEVLYGHAWALEAAPQTGPEGEVHIGLEQIGRRSR